MSKRDRDASHNKIDELTRHVQLQLAFQVFANANPFVLARLGLLEMYDVVARWSVAVLVESKFVSA